MRVRLLFSLQEVHVALFPRGAFENADFKVRNKDTSKTNKRRNFTRQSNLFLKEACWE